VVRDTVALVPLGTRAALDLRVAGRPVLSWTLDALAGSSRLVEIVVACEAALPESGGRAVPVRSIRVGPATGRLAALRAALAAAPPAPRVAVHEADRPLTSAAQLDAILEAADRHPAAVAALPARNTLKEVADGGRILRTVPRERLHQVQTPAAFDRALLEEALRRDRGEGWGCAGELQLAARAGCPPHLVMGHALNVPVSSPESAAFAELAMGRRVTAGGRP
jgi:2-C-methyl-D-erythritol 4-phosphate cytidylyltransferase